SRSGAEGRHEPLSAPFSLSEAKGERLPSAAGPEPLLFTFSRNRHRGRVRCRASLGHWPSPAPSVGPLGLSLPSRPLSLLCALVRRRPLGSCRCLRLPGRPLTSLPLRPSASLPSPSALSATRWAAPSRSRRRAPPGSVFPVAPRVSEY